MKNKKFYTLFVAVLLLCAILFNTVSCTKIKATDLMEDIEPQKVEARKDLSSSNADVTDFAVRLFKTSNEEGKNTLISPLSILCALSMTANGAKGETLEQMEDVMGMSVEELNLYLYSYMNSLPKSQKCKLNLANSIWFRDDKRFTANQDFLQTNADYYGASLYKAPFDKSTLNGINDWVKEKTDGMIPKVIDEIPLEAVMYLVNALAFEAEWSDIYEKNQVRDGTFTKEDGTKQSAEFMYSEEYRYLEDEKATGFMKYYKGGNYAFVALLPNENVTVSEYLNSLDGESLNALFSSTGGSVQAAIPKFETKYSAEMSEILKSMGMPLAFDEDNADFSGLGSSSAGNIYINRVIHKTFISVAEKGTKAGAATVIEMANKGDSAPNEIKRVYLDRPFVYMLVDCENNLPFL